MPGNARSPRTFNATELARLAPIASPSPGVSSNAPGYLYEGKNAGRWVLKNQAGTTVKSFTDKASATAAGVLARAIKRGTVQIHKANGRIQEERTYPRSADPRRSPG